MRTSSELPGHTLPPHAADVTGRPAEETTAPDAVKEARDDGDDVTEEEEVELIQGQESRESVATGTVGEDTAPSLAREDTASDRLFVAILRLRPRRPPPRPQHRPPSRPARPAVSQPGEGLGGLGRE